MAREAHANGEIVKTLFGRVKELLAKEPQIHKLDLLGSKVPGSARAHTA